MRLIGLAGSKRSGKNTVGNILEAIYGDGQANVVTVGFADKLKIAAARALGFDRPEADLIALMDSFKEGASFSILYEEPGTEPSQHEDNAVLHALTGREYLQWFGTEACRQTFADSFWIDLVLPNPTVIAMKDPWGTMEPIEVLKVPYPDADLVVVTDVRFPNEALRIYALGGEVWEVTRPGTGGADGHASEKPLPRELVNKTIVNDGSLSDLENKVEAAL